MARARAWTTDKPTEPGFYWRQFVRRDGSPFGDKIMVEVFRSGASLRMLYRDLSMPLSEVGRAQWMRIGDNA